MEHYDWVLDKDSNDGSFIFKKIQTPRWDICTLTKWGIIFGVVSIPAALIVYLLVECFQ